MFPIAAITAMRFLAHEFDKSTAAEPMSEFPCRPLVAPHQRRVDNEALIHAERQGRLQGFERIVAAVGIARIVGLAHATDQVTRAAAIADRGRESEEEQVAAGNKGVRQPALRQRNRGFAGERRIANPSYYAEIDEVVVGELLIPLREFAPQPLQRRHPAIELDAVALPVIEADGFDRSKALKRPGQARCRILAAGK